MPFKRAQTHPGAANVRWSVHAEGLVQNGSHAPNAALHMLTDKGTQNMDRLTRAILAITAESPDDIDQGEFGEAIDALVDIIATLIVAGAKGDNQMIDDVCHAVSEELIELCVTKKLVQDGVL